MSHWSAKLYERVDAGDPTVNEMFSPDVEVQYGNYPVRSGHEALYAGEIGRQRSVASSSHHEFLNIWDVDNNTAILDSIVTYQRVDGVNIDIPVITILHRRSDGLIDRLRISMDNRPLFDGFSS